MRIILSAFLILSILLAFCSPALSQEEDVLHKLAAPHGFKMGAAMSYYQLRDTKYLNLLKKHFNSVTMTNEMKAYSMLDQAGSKRSKDGMPAINYTAADAMVGWAKANGLQVRGHVLVWDAYMCDWFFREEYSNNKPYADAETIKARTEYYITQVITHFEEKFPGVVYCWDVVNEAVGDNITEFAPNDPRHLRTKRNGGDNLFQKYMGDDYVALSFLYARNAVETLGADIKLYYNDYNAYFTDKAEAILALGNSVNTFAKDENGNYRKLMDGVGMQGYIGGYGTQTGCLEPAHVGMIKNAILNYANAGFEVQITEMAVRNFDLAYTEEHTEFYTNLFKAFVSLGDENGNNPLNCVAIWGLTDNPNDKPGTYTYSLNSPYCGLFNEKLEDKDVLYKVMEVLKK
ncbi:MAG: endo-1,4-beta-xylanase [Clostridia bacterium]|nr:endo-1,4-beta-xylanase [Clostridia bacterium]